jgi:hypothetical protein
VVDDRIAELERVLRADAGGKVLAALLLRVLAGAGRGGELHRRLEAWAGEEPVEEAADAEFERAFEAAEPDLERMITPDSLAEEATLAADTAVEERSPLASSGAFATRTMAELLEKQGDRRGAERIRAALGEAPDAGLAQREDDTSVAVIAVLERWLENARRLQA